MELRGIEPLIQPSEGVDVPDTEPIHTRTNDKQINTLQHSDSSVEEHNQTSGEQQNNTILHPKCVTCVQQNVPDDLREVMGAWEHLPEAVKAGIVAMVKAAREGA